MARRFRSRKQLPKLFHDVASKWPENYQFAFESPYLWIGSGNHWTGVHTDRYPNANYVLSGRKRFYLWPPSEMKNLRMAPVELNPYLNFRSMLGPEDIEQDPDVRSGAYQVELGRGDAIYIPPYWWHGVYSSGLNVAINFWWQSVSASQIDDAFLAMYAALYGLKALPEDYQKFWIAFLNHWIPNNPEHSSHLPFDNQGLTGTQSDKIREVLRERVIEFSSNLKARNHAIFESRFYVVTEGISIELMNQLDEPARKLLMHFRNPRRPQDIRSKRLNGKLLESGRTFEESIRELLVGGYLTVMPLPK